MELTSTSNCTTFQARRLGVRERAERGTRPVATLNGTLATTRVMIESADHKGDRWATVGVSANVIDASYNALNDAITYKLLRDGAEA